MRKYDIVVKISQETGIQQIIVKKIVQKMLDIIIETLRNKQRIELREFGIFEIKKRKKRIGRNPKTGKIIPIPERFVVTFKPGLKLKDI